MDGPRSRRAFLRAAGLVGSLAAGSPAGARPHSITDREGQRLSPRGTAAAGHEENGPRATAHCTPGHRPGDPACDQLVDDTASLTRFEVSGTGLPVVFDYPCGWETAVANPDEKIITATVTRADVGEEGAFAAVEVRVYLAPDGSNAVAHADDSDAYEGFNFFYAGEPYSGFITALDRVDGAATAQTVVPAADGVVNVSVQAAVRGAACEGSDPPAYHLARRMLPSLEPAPGTASPLVPIEAGETYYLGQDLVATGFAGTKEVTLAREDGRAVRRLRVADDGRVVFATAPLSPGRYRLGAGDQARSFALNTQSFAVSPRRATVTADGDDSVVRFDVGSNRRSFEVLVSAAGIDDETLARVFEAGTLVEDDRPGRPSGVRFPVRGRDALGADFAGVPAGSVDLVFRVADTGVGETVTITVRTVADAAPAVAIDDQVATHGRQVDVAAVTLPEGGFVSIHDERLRSGAPLRSIRGASEALEPGTHENVVVSLDAPLSESGTVLAVASLDTDGDGRYEFGSSGGAEDGPYTVDGELVVDSALVEVPSPLTPSATPVVPDTTGSAPSGDGQRAEPTAQAGPATARDGSSGTTSDGAGPGFTSPGALLALLGSGLLADRWRRRRQ